jgi:tetratricopeptide (TPR) repeat protein
MRLNALALALVLVAAGTVRAQDDDKKKSADLLGQARTALGEKQPDVKKARELAEKALELDKDNYMAHVLLSFIFDVKLGDGDKALEHVDLAIRGVPPAKNDKDFGPRKFKAELIANKAVILYSYKDDLEGARDLFKASMDNYELSSTADKLSNLLHRLSGLSKDPKKKEEQAKMALKYAEIALELPAQKKDPAAQKKWIAKVKLQLSLCREVLGDKDGAKKALEAVDAEDMDDATLYNQAMLDALHGDEKAVREKLTAFMKATRPEARSRNQLRKFIRTEPDFQKWVNEESWKELVTPETE